MKTKFKNWTIFKDGYLYMTLYENGSVSQHKTAENAANSSLHARVKHRIVDRVGNEYAAYTGENGKAYLKKQGATHPQRD